MAERRHLAEGAASGRGGDSQLRGRHLVGCGTMGCAKSDATSLIGVVNSNIWSNTEEHRCPGHHVGLGNVCSTTAGA